MIKNINFLRIAFGDGLFRGWGQKYWGGPGPPWPPPRDPPDFKLVLNWVGQGGQGGQGGLSKFSDI